MVLLRQMITKQPATSLNIMHIARSPCLHKTYQLWLMRVVFFLLLCMTDVRTVLAPGNHLSTQAVAGLNELRRVLVVLHNAAKYKSVPVSHAKRVQWLVKGQLILLWYACIA
jgi:hypothetical protein